MKKLLILVLLFFSVMISHSKEGNHALHTVHIARYFQSSARFGKMTSLQYSTNIKQKNPEWKMVFDEEFNDPNENLNKKWNILNEPQDFNKSKQYYSPSNIKIREGHLEIITRKQAYRYKQYTSGAMTTKNKFDFKYGKVEIKAQLPYGKGIFPAF